MDDDDLLRLGQDQFLLVVGSTPEALRLESTWNSSERKPPRHFHPKQDERFEVLEGELTVELDAEPPRVLRAGESLDVPRGTVHRMWNAGPEVAKASWRVTPRLRTEELFRYMHSGITPVRFANLLWTYRHEYRLGIRLPRR